MYTSGDGLANLENDEEFSKEVEIVALAPKQNKRCLRFQFLQKVGYTSRYKRSWLIW